MAACVSESLIFVFFGRRVGRIKSFKSSESSKSPSSRKLPDGYCCSCINRLIAAASSSLTKASQSNEWRSKRCKDKSRVTFHHQTVRITSRDSLLRRRFLVERCIEFRQGKIIEACTIRRIDGKCNEKRRNRETSDALDHHRVLIVVELEYRYRRDEFRSLSPSLHKSQFVDQSLDRLRALLAMRSLTQLRISHSLYFSSSFPSLVANASSLDRLLSLSVRFLTLE